MGGPIFTQSTWQLCAGRLLVLVPGLGQEVFNILVVEGSDVKTNLLVTSFNLHVEGDLYLIAAPWYKGGIQRHLVLPNRNVGRIPIERIVCERAMKISHDA
jgi:hypothetical protein